LSLEARLRLCFASEHSVALETRLWLFVVQVCFASEHSVALETRLWLFVVQVCFASEHFVAHAALDSVSSDASTAPAVEKTHESRRLRREPVGLI
jgi:hypothetical protein